MTLAPLLVLLVHASNTVELSLDDYLTLSQKKTEPSFTVIESVRLAGSLGHGVTLTLAGRSFGDRPAVVALAGDVVLKGCSDDALLQRSPQGEVVLTPLKAKFTVRCTVEHGGAAEWGFKVPGVVDVGGALSDAVVELTGIKDGAATLLIRRPTPELPEEVGEAKPISWVGRYRLTLSPDDTRFRWELSAHNPNRHVIRFPLVQRPGETIEQLETQARYDSDPKGYTVELPPGETQLTVTGQMTQPRFEPPFDAAAQFVLVDAHPLLRVELASEGKRISPAETQMQAQFRAAQALLLSRGQHAEWKATALETLPSNRYTVSALAGEWYVGPDGVLLGHTNITLDNQGAPELRLPMSATPELASVGGAAMPLTTNKHHELSLPLATGPQSLHLEQRSALKTGLGFAAGRLELPGVGATAKVASLQVRAGRDWVPLFEGFAGRTWFALPSLGQLVLIALFALWAVRLFASLGVGRRPSIALGALTSVLASSTDASHWPVLIGLAAGSMLWVATWLRESKVRLVAPSGFAGLFMVLAVGMIAMVGGVTLFGDNIRRLYGMSADALAGDDRVAQRGGSYDASLSKKTLKSFGENETAYEGIGAAQSLPYGTQNVELWQEMADTREPTTATVVLVSKSLVNLTWMGVQLSALVLAFALRNRLIDGIKKQLERLFAARLTEPVLEAA